MSPGLESPISLKRKQIQRGGHRPLSPGLGTREGRLESGFNPGPVTRKAPRSGSSVGGSQCGDGDCEGTGFCDLQPGPPRPASSGVGRGGEEELSSLR